jgi:hypothetical protein
MQNNTTRVYENSKGDMVITDVEGVAVIPWGGDVKRYTYGLRSWATDSVDAAQRAYAEGYSLDAIDENGREIYVRKV